jgi:hypothetical protein
VVDVLRLPPVESRAMRFFTCDVVPNPGGLLPYKVVFKRRDVVLGEWAVRSVAEGEAQFAAALRTVEDLVPEGDL